MIAENLVEEAMLDCRSVRGNLPKPIPREAIGYLRYAPSV